MTTTTPNSPPTKKVEKQRYDTFHRSRLQGVHTFLVARVFQCKTTRGLSYALNQVHLLVHTFHHSVEVETRGRKGRVTSDQVCEADAILQDDSLGLEAKGLSWQQLAKQQVGADVKGRTVHSVMRDALDYNKYLAWMKG